MAKKKQYSGQKRRFVDLTAQSASAQMATPMYQRQNMGFVNLCSPDGELKYHDEEFAEDITHVRTISGAATPTAEYHLIPSISLITRGNAGGRDGRIALLKKLQLRLNVNVPNGTIPLQVRIVVVRDAECKDHTAYGSAQSVAELLFDKINGDMAPSAWQKIENSKRFTILKSWLWTPKQSDNTQGNDVLAELDLFRPFDKTPLQLHYEIPDAGNAANDKSSRNNIFVLTCVQFQPDKSTPDGSAFGDVRIRMRSRLRFHG